MITPAFETFLTAMMCLCPNTGNITTEMQSGGKSESAVFTKNDIIYIKQKMDTLEKSLEEVQNLQVKILQQLNFKWIKNLLNIINEVNQEQKLSIWSQMFGEQQFKMPELRSPKADIPIASDAHTACTSERQIIIISIPKLAQSFQFLCNGDIDGFGDSWLVIQQRYDGSVNFFRQWTDYVRGFGTLQGEFFIGLEKLHAMTTAQPHELIIIMEDFENDRRFAQYEQFEIGSANESFALKVLGNYQGNAGDSLRRHVAHKFSTFDNDNDIYQANCAVEYTGAWWYDECETSNLNGQYLKGKLSQDKYGKGMSWDTFRGLDYSLKSIKMMIRPKK